MPGYTLVIVDMIKDNVKPSGSGLLDREAARILPVINRLSGEFRNAGQKVVFACDSFMEGDFIFGGRMGAHAIRGSGGDMPIDELVMKPEDVYLPKRRMSAFYKTDLDQTLRLWGAHTIVVCGIVTNVCVLLTALDAIQNDFRAVIVSDACACHKAELHEQTLGLYRGLILDPLFRILPSEDMIAEITAA
jgi:nicotinamidase-related amidase